MGRPRSDPDKPPVCAKGHGPQERITDRSRVQGWRWHCSECVREAKRRSYANHREQQIERVTRYQREHAELVAENNRKQNAKKKRRRQALVAAERRIRGGCEVCGATADLHWHHRDPSTKVASISRMKSEGFSLDALEAELEKCALLCRAHHAEVHRVD